MASKKPYNINQSPIYKLSSKRKLAELLRIDIKDLLSLIEVEKDNYKIWSSSSRLVDRIVNLPSSKTKKSRTIQEPKPRLYSIQKRLSILLSRIETPEFLYSAKKGRSYYDNALAHQNRSQGMKIDIKSFYSSVRQSQVKSFFQKDLLCSEDLAHLLSRICCYEGFLPTGSPLSPILSFFVCKDMFEKINKASSAKGIVFSLYVDDMFFSGDNADRDFAGRIFYILKSNGFVGHKYSVFPANSVKVITGVAVSEANTALPYKRRMRIRLFEESIPKIDNIQNRIKVCRALIGQYREAERIQPGMAAKAVAVEQMLKKLELSKIASQ